MRSQKSVFFKVRSIVDVTANSASGVQYIKVEVGNTVFATLSILRALPLKICFEFWRLSSRSEPDL